MGLCRFLYNNLITSESMITVTSLRNGIVTGSLKNGTGSATLNTAGNYSGSTDLEYIVEIDSIAGGAEVGQATFKWSDGGGSWDATGVTTDSTPVTLNNGVTVAWTTGSGADFVVGDKWYFKGVNLFNAGKLIDLNRDHRYRSAALGAPNTITIDLVTAQEVKALVIYDHNFTSGVTLLLEADDAATFDSDGGNAQFSEAVSYNSEKIIHYLSTATTKRYWRLSVTDAANTDTYIEIGEIFLGSYVELSRNYTIGFNEDIEFLVNRNYTAYGIGQDRFYNTQAIFSIDFSAIVAADITKLKAIVTSVASQSTGIFKPFWFNFNSATPNDTYLVKMESLPFKHIVKTYFNTSLTFTEVPKSV